MGRGDLRDRMVFATAQWSVASVGARGGISQTSPKQVPGNPRLLQLACVSKEATSLPPVACAPAHEQAIEWDAMNRYIYDQSWEQERERLASLEEHADPQTVRNLEALGVAEGWRCLEVGGGGGSITKWLSRRVGRTGWVVATDLDTRFLEELNEPNVEVRRHDITSEDLEEQAFDLVHARAVLEHLPDRAQALGRMVAALRPEGWALIEDVDFLFPISASESDTFVVPESAAALSAKVMRAVKQMMTAAGVDAEYGRRLPGELEKAGLTDVGGEGRFSLLRGGSPVARGVARLSFGQLRGRIAGTGLLSESELDELVSLFEDPSFAGWSVTMVSAWGRRPES